MKRFDEEQVIGFLHEAEGRLSSRSCAVATGFRKPALPLA